MATTAWRDLALDSNGDLILTGGDLKLVQGTAAIVQECRTALGLWAGEYPFDIEVGTQWQTILNTKAISDATITAEVRRVLLNVDGVVSVDNIEIARNTVARTARISAAVRGNEGAVLTVPAVELGVGG